MTPDDVRLTAQLVAAGRVHCVSDAATLAMARRVLELEAEVAAIRARGGPVARAGSPTLREPEE